MQTTVAAMLKLIGRGGPGGAPLENEVGNKPCCYFHNMRHMEITSFLISTAMSQQSPASGTWQEGGWGVRTFNPNPLPPPIEMTPVLTRALSEADRAIGRLAGEGQHLPNPHLLLRPFVRREAVHSSHIEGTQATLGELLAAEAGAIVEHSPDDLREVGNYVVALEEGIRELERIPLSLRLVRDMHARLMRGVRGEYATPGEFRRSQNWIGPAGCTLQNASYVPPPPESLMDHLGTWEKFLHDRSLPPLLQVGLIHYQFEAIHPFLDGNGRVGRLMITLFLQERGLLPAPLLYLSAFFDATRSEYYERLSAVTQKADWQGWLHYFLNGVARQSEDALGRCEQINELLSRWREAVAGTKADTPRKIVEHIASNPFITGRGIQRELHIGYNTGMRAVERLIDAGILRQVGTGQRDRVFCAKELLDILEAPAKLLP